MASGTIVVDISGNTDGDVICSLLKRPFRERNHEEKLAILKRNRPKPSLEVFEKANPKNKEYTGTGLFAFCAVECNSWWYDNFEWLCGSREKDKIYCWPCVLFHVNENMFTRGVDVDQNSLTAVAYAHDKSNSHNICVATLHKERERFGVVPILQQKVVVNTDKEDAYNDEVKRNRDLFKKLIAVVMVLYNVDCAVPYILPDSTRIVKFKTMFELATEHDCYLQEFCEELGDVYEDVIKSAFRDIMVCIKLELQCFTTSELIDNKTHPFWSIQVDGANCINGKHSNSIMLRYIDASGNLQERHLGFSIQSNKSAKKLSQYMSLRTEQLARNDYLVSQSYDGACISVDDLLELQNKVAKGAVLVPSIDHPLNTVLLDGLSHMSGCKMFVMILQDFLINDKENNTGLYKILELPGLRSEHDVPILNANLLKQMVVRRNIVIDCYEEKMLCRHMDWPIEHLHTLMKFCNSMEDVEFVSFLLVFMEILKVTDEMTNGLARQRASARAYNSLTSLAIEMIKQISIRKLTADAYLMVTGSKSPNITNQKAFEKLVELHNSIIENVTNQISVRYGNCKQLAFLTLVDSTKFPAHNKSFPDTALVSLNSLYKKHFKTEWLKDELKIFIYNDQQFYHKSPLAIIKLLIAKDMKELLPESFKLFCLVATMPIWPETYLDSSCFERTQAFLHESRRFKAESLLKSDLSTVVINKPTVNQLAAQHSWHDKLMKQYKYATENNCYSLHLQFKEKA